MTYVMLIKRIVLTILTAIAPHFLLKAVEAEPITS